MEQLRWHGACWLALARVHSCAVIGLEGAPGIEVVVDTWQGLHGMTILGLKDRII